MTIIDGAIDVGHYNAVSIVVSRRSIRSNKRECRLHAVPVRRRIRSKHAERPESWSKQSRVGFDVCNSVQVESQRTQPRKRRSFEQVQIGF